jgi:hypothetical protein
MARHTIPADSQRRRGRALDVILDDADEDKFDVLPEDVPADLPTMHGNRTITWHSNFSLRKRPGKPNSGGVVEYTIEVDDPGGQLLYFDVGARTLVFVDTRVVGKRIQATLGVEDPPIGSI